MEEKETEFSNLTIILNIKPLRVTLKRITDQLQILTCSKVNQFIKLIGNFLKSKGESYSLVVGW